MRKTHIRQKVVLSAMAGAIMIPGSVLSVTAAEETEEQPFIQANRYWKNVMRQM